MVAKTLPFLSVSDVMQIQIDAVTVCKQTHACGTQSLNEKTATLDPLQQLTAQIGKSVHMIALDLSPAAADNDIALRRVTQLLTISNRLGDVGTLFR